MDFSKLPKFSDTKGQMPSAISTPDVTDEKSAAPPAHSPRTADAVRRRGLGVDIWISVIVGILFLMMGKQFSQYAIAKVRHQPFHTGITWENDENPQKAGQEKGYFDLNGFTALSEMGIFLFGAMLLFEAAAKAAALLLKPGPVPIIILSLALSLMTLATLINIYACIKLFNFGITPITSALAVAFGGWIAFDEFKTIQSIRYLRKYRLS